LKTPGAADDAPPARPGNVLCAGPARRERRRTMERLQQFTQLLCGSFDNAAQFRQMQAKGEAAFPFARHVNTPCNEKIRGLPQGFDGVFVVEESYYTVNGRTHASPHLFLFTQQGENIKLTSYDLPQGCGKAGFTFETMGEVAFGDLSPSKKFTPAVYTCRGGVWEGGSTSMFTPALKFTLFERFSSEGLEVSETMEMNGKRTFGYDVPILYRRTEDTAQA